MKRPAIIEVKPASDGLWYYHERYAGKIKNVSQRYSRKSAAVRAARREAAEQGSRVDIFNLDGTVTKDALLH